jgi:hypothetical protein
MEADRFIYSLAEWITDLEVFSGQPASDTFDLKVCVETVCKILIPGAVADEAGVELKGLITERF